MASPIPDNQSEYWDRVSGEKSFTHPVRWDWLSAHLVTLDPRRRERARLLDVGCGYGRVLSDVEGRLGLDPSRSIGADASGAMLQRARKAGLANPLVRCSQALPFPDGSFDVVTLLSVLTCNPDPSDRMRFVGEIQRVLAPGGVLFVSDLLLQNNERNQRRYADGRAQFGQDGVFALDEGVVLAHLPRSEVDSLFKSFELAEYAAHEVRTMNGNRSDAFHLLARCR